MLSSKGVRHESIKPAKLVGVRKWNGTYSLDPIHSASVPRQGVGEARCREMAEKTARFVRTFNLSGHDLPWVSTGSGRETGAEVNAPCLFVIDEEIAGPLTKNTPITDQVSALHNRQRFANAVIRDQYAQAAIP